MLVFNTVQEGKIFISNIDNRKIVYNSLIEDIKDALIFELSFVSIFRYEKENMHHFLYKDKWVSSLNKALEYFEYIEDYEECIEIKNLISILKDVYF